MTETLAPPTTMLAAQLRGAVGSGDVALVEVPVPEPGSGELLVRGAAQRHLRQRRALRLRRHRPDGVHADRARPRTRRDRRRRRSGRRRPRGRQPGERGPARDVHGVRPVPGRPHGAVREADVPGADCEGAFAEYLAVPARNCLPSPTGCPTTSRPWPPTLSRRPTTPSPIAAASRGQPVVVWGTGGLGLGRRHRRTLGASRVIAVDARAEARHGARDRRDEGLEPEGSLERSAGWAAWTSPSSSSARRSPPRARCAASTTAAAPSSSASASRPSRPGG